MLFTVYLSVIGLVFFIFLWKRKQFKHNYAPGLPAWPIVGSLPYFKSGHFHFLLHEWAKKYGQVISAYIGNEPTLIVTGADNVLAALRKEEFQGRPDSVPIRSRSFDKKAMGIFFSDGHQWTESRRFTIKHLRAFGITQIEQFMSKEINVLNDSIQDGAVMEMNGIFSLSLVNVIWCIIANKTFQLEDERIKLFLTGNRTFFRGGTVAGDVVSAFPILQYVNKPFLERKKHIQETQRLIKELIDEHRQILDPNHPFDLIDHYLVEMEKQKGNVDSVYTEENLITICFDLFSAGAEPLTAALDFVMLYMMLYPDVQKKVQEELDSVLAKARKPLLEDRDRLHYTMAVLNEVARINPTVTISVPHRCTKDTHFNNYFVEKDTTIFIDLWTLGYDPKYWDKPEEFRPERFLDSEGQLNKNTIIHPFGFGQRICAGESLSKNIMFLFITTFFERYSLSVPAGEPRPSTYPLAGFTTGPQQFRAVIKSRY